jgi:hypothetical protein
MRDNRPEPPEGAPTNFGRNPPTNLQRLPEQTEKGLQRLGKGRNRSVEPLKKKMTQKVIETNFSV